jgi:hypothetical protein
LEDVLPFLKSTEEELKFNTEMTRAEALLLDPATMMEAVTLTRSLKGPKEREFTNDEIKQFTEKR